MIYCIYCIALGGMLGIVLRLDFGMTKCDRLTNFLREADLPRYLRLYELLSRRVQCNVFKAIEINLLVLHILHLATRMTAATTAAAAERDLLERVRRFQFDKFDKSAEEWIYYIQRFETELAISGLLADDVMTHRRNLLLSRVGPEAFRVVVDHFRPDPVNTKTYDELKLVLHSFYQKNVCIMAERVAFCQRHRKEGETVAQFVIALRSLAGNCDFGASLSERLRDQLVIGLSNDSWQKEIFRLHPTNAATLAQVQASVLVLEQASTQQQRLQSLTRGSDAVHHVASQFSHKRKSPTSISSSSSRRGTVSGKVRQLFEGKNCFKCGNNIHSSGEKCPADGIVCSACHKLNHFAKVCVKTGRAEIAPQSSKSNRKQLNNIDLESESDDELVDLDDELHMIATVHRSGKMAVLSAKLNGYKLQMLYDPGAVFSVISHSTWKQIGSPVLTPTPNLLAYTKVPIITLGSASISVSAFRQYRKSLTVIVIEGEDKPLFGLDWVQEFDLPLPEGVSICALRSARQAQSVDESVTFQSSSFPVSSADRAPSVQPSSSARPSATSPVNSSVRDGLQQL